MAEYKTRAVLQDLLEAANRMMVDTAQMTYDVFLADLKPQEAVVRNYEILGEATQQIPDEFRQHAPHIPWTSIAGMRDTLIHVTVLPGPFFQSSPEPLGLSSRRTLQHGKSHGVHAERQVNKTVKSVAKRKCLVTC